MALLPVVAVVVLALVLGYSLYGRFVARQYQLDDRRITPATSQADGADFVPTHPFYLMGQHFSAISAAGPIVGPIAAAMVFGWLPSVLWIVLGVIFIGAVHDVSALVASVRHGANSIAEMAKENVGNRAWISIVAFIWLALVYVIVAFADVTATTFVGATSELAGRFSFNPGGAVAAASTMYLMLALAMGLLQRTLNPPIWITTAVFVPGTLVIVWLGTQLSTILVYEVASWHIAILIYCFVASLLPIWVLQQPRGYLGGFVLYLAIGLGFAGIILGGFEIQQPAINTLRTGTGIEEMMFPFLFVTIACGACSGFHGLVCGGTTSKQIALESHCRPIGYGGMILEALVAVIALSTVMILPPQAIGGRAPGKIYGDGLATFFASIFGKETFVFAATFGAMAFSTFVFDTLDISTRLGRYLLQELVGSRVSARRSRTIGVFASGLTAFVPLVILSSATASSWRSFWVLFGTSNQLLAALTLLGVTLWLYRSGRRYWYTFLPTVFLLAVTLYALAIQIWEGWQSIARHGFGFSPVVINGVIAGMLLGLAGVFILDCINRARNIRQSRLETMLAASSRPA